MAKLSLTIVIILILNGIAIAATSVPLPTDSSGAVMTPSEMKYIELTNKERVSRGLSLLSVDPLLVQVVDLKFFCGFSFAEIGAMWGQSERTVQRHWEKARIYLHGAIGKSV